MRFLIVGAVVALVLGGGAAAYATVVGYPTHTVTVMTGCLTTSGTGAGSIVNVAASASSPSKACGSNQKLVHISGGTITRVTAGTGLMKNGLGGPGYVDSGFATLGLKPGFALPQTCSVGQVPKWDVDAHNSDWVCGADQNTTYDGTNFATSGQDCPSNGFAHGIDTSGNLKCGTPDNTTYDGTNFATSGQDCPSFQFATGIDTSGNLKCAPSDNRGVVNITQEFQSVEQATPLGTLVLDCRTPQSKTMYYFRNRSGGGALDFFEQTNGGAPTFFALNDGADTNSYQDASATRRTWEIGAGDGTSNALEVDVWSRWTGSGCQYITHWSFGAH